MLADTRTSRYIQGMFAERKIEIACALITAPSRRCYATATLPLSSVFSTPTLVVAHISISLRLSQIATDSHRHTHVVRNIRGCSKIPNARQSLLLLLLPPSTSTCSYTAVCIYASYIITPDGASTSRTLSKAPHDSVYLLNTEYNISLAYTCT